MIHNSVTTPEGGQGLEIGRSVFLPAGRTSAKGASVSEVVPGKEEEQSISVLEALVLQKGASLVVGDV